MYYENIQGEINWLYLCGLNNQISFYQVSDKPKFNCTQHKYYFLNNNILVNNTKML